MSDAVPVPVRPQMAGGFGRSGVPRDLRVCLQTHMVDSAVRGLRTLLSVHVAVPGRRCVCAGVHHRHVDHPLLQYDPVGSAGE